MIVNQLLTREVSGSSKCHQPTWAKDSIPSRFKFPLSRFLNPFEQSVLLGFSESGKSLVFYGLDRNKSFKLFWKDLETLAVTGEIVLFQHHQLYNSNTIVSSVLDKELLLWEFQNIHVAFGFAKGSFFNKSDVVDSSSVELNDNVVPINISIFYQTPIAVKGFHFVVEGLLMPSEESLRPRPFQFVQHHEKEYDLILNKCGTAILIVHFKEGSEGRDRITNDSKFFEEYNISMSSDAESTIQVNNIIITLVLKMIVL